MINTLFNKLKNRTIVNDSQCWVWQGAISSSGYGNTIWDGKYLNTHRAMYLSVYHEIQPSYYVCHSCDNRLCINPSHLFLALQKDNIHDMINKNRNAKGATLSDAIKRGWTPELRAKRALQMHNRMKQHHDMLAIQAAVPLHWKYCFRCNEWQPRQNYHKHKNRPDGLHVYCKLCRSNNPHSLI